MPRRYDLQKSTFNVEVFFANQTLDNIEDDPALASARATFNASKQAWWRELEKQHVTQRLPWVHSSVCLKHSTKGGPRGKGVFAAKAIKKNVWLGEYLGDIITVAEASTKSNRNNPFLFNVRVERMGA